MTHTASTKISKYKFTGKLIADCDDKEFRIFESNTKISLPCHDFEDDKILSMLGLEEFWGNINLSKSFGKSIWNSNLYYDFFITGSYTKNDSTYTFNTYKLDLIRVSKVNAEI